MKIATWDSGDPEMYFDNPNLRWGNPSYLLEPGDPGYVPPFPSVNTTKTKGKKVKHNNYYPLRQAEQVAWLLNFADKLPGKAAELGLTPAQVTALVAECLWLAYCLQNWINDVRTFALGCTQTLNTVQTGDGTGAVVLNTFAAPDLPEGVTPQPPGSLLRVFASVQDIKNSRKCSDGTARELGIVGSEAIAPDLTAVQPVITARVTGAEVAIGWGWQGNRAWLDACELVVDRADGKGFVPLAMDTTPNYNDTHPFPAAKAIWNYKAIYRQEDKQVGQWSQVVTVTVGG